MRRGTSSGGARVGLVGLAALAALALAAWLVLRRGEARDAPLDAAVEAVAAEDAGPGVELVPAAAPLAAPPATTEREPAPERVMRVAGRVEVEGGLPAGEDVLVVARPRREGASKRDAPRIPAAVAPDGSFALEVSADTRRVELDLEARLLFLEDEVEVEPGREDVVLRPTVLAAVRGHVRFAAGAAPCSEEPVRVTCGSSTVAAGADGVFEAIFEPGEELVLVARSAGTGPECPLATGQASIDPLRAGETRAVDVWLEARYAPFGIVVDPLGKPIEGASVFDAALGEPVVPGALMRIGPELRGIGMEVNRRTGADGRFELAPLSPGRHALVASAPGRFAARVELDWPRDAGHELRIVLDAAAVVRGRVLAPDGSPVADAIVVDSNTAPLCVPDPGGGTGLRMQTHGGFASPPWRRTDADGRFELPVDTTEARVVAFAPGFAPSAPLALDLRAAAEFDDVVLSLREPCVLRGRVLDEDGAPFCVSLRYRAADGLELLMLTSPSEAELEAAMLPPGRATLVVQASRHHRATGSVDVELVAGRETVVEVRVREE